MKAALVIPLLLLLTACGFQLRGIQSWDHLRFNIVVPQKDCLSNALTRQLPSIEDEDKDLLPRLVIQRNQLVVSALTYNSFNQVYQQRLNYEVVFSLVSPTGEILIPETTISSDREQRITNTAPLSDQQERKMLEESLCQEVAQQLLWQISQQYADHP